MGKKVKSAKGEVVDFDLMKIKEQMAATPILPDVQARQDFIDKRLRRRLRKVKTPAPKLASEEPLVQPEMPGTEELSEPSKMIDEVKAPVEPPIKVATKKTIKQKARPKSRVQEQGESDVQVEGNS